MAANTDGQNYVLPVDISFKDWAARLRLSFPNENIPLVPSEDYWWQWAQALLRNRRFSAGPVPSKALYKNKEDWQRWALFFAQTVLI